MSVEERLAADIIKAIKASKLAIGPQQTEGSSEGAGLITEVPNEPIIGTGAHDDSKDSWGSKCDDDEEDDNDNDQIIDLEENDKEVMCFKSFKFIMTENINFIKGKHTVLSKLVRATHSNRDVSDNPK
ncbi:hypothetical protein Tco_0375411 [Tanacetum coccineum]